MNDNEQCLDSQLWHACAGGMVQMPLVNSKVFYFPQGHVEHSESPIYFGDSPRISPLILCRVNFVKYMAETKTDEVYAKIFMTPLSDSELDYFEYDGLTLGSHGSESKEKPSSFAKTLTQSDANNGGGFSVPRYCAETIFPRLNYSVYPPVQEVKAKDVHGKIWKFRHIYRGTPRRHLLTTGWSNFISEKRLVAGDSIIFLRTRNSDLCVGIRRAKSGFWKGLESPIGWSHPMGGFPMILREEENKFIRGNNNEGANIRARGKVTASSVIEAMTLAVNGQPFEVVYYPRASTPEFCVMASAVKAALRIQWCVGMRFKMAFETEDSSRISWFMGTITDSRVYDPVRWPGSPWRLLQVSWDEPDLLQNVRSISPWLVELISSMPVINLAHLSPPRKKNRILQLSDFPLEFKLPAPIIPENLLTPSSSPLCRLSDNNTSAAGIQGARHSQCGTSCPELRSVHRLDHFSPRSRISTGLIVRNSAIDGVDNSCMLTIGNSQSVKKECKKHHQFILFGKVIPTKEELSPIRKHSSYDLNSMEIMSKNLSFEPLYSNQDKRVNELGLEIEQCKVFMESEDAGRILDLSTIGSYEELYRSLASMFGIEKSELASRLLYRDAAGALRHTEDEPFIDFMKAARRLTIMMDSSRKNGGKL